jgi:hypothetical protein
MIAVNNQSDFSSQTNVTKTKKWDKTKVNLKNAKFLLGGLSKSQMKDLQGTTKNKRKKIFSKKKTSHQRRYQKLSQILV